MPLQTTKPNVSHRESHCHEGNGCALSSHSTSTMLTHGQQAIAVGFFSFKAFPFVTDTRSSLLIAIILAAMWSSAVPAEIIERDRSAEMERVFHFCRNQALSNPRMMQAITQGGKTLTGLCECIASNLVAAVPDNLVAALRRGERTPELDSLYARMGRACAWLPG